MIEKICVEVGWEGGSYVVVCSEVGRKCKVAWGCGGPRVGMQCAWKYSVVGIPASLEPPQLAPGTIAPLQAQG